MESLINLYSEEWSILNLRLTEVLCQDVFWCMGDPIIDHKRCANRVEVAIVESQEILILVCQTLDDVCFTFWKIPDVPLY